MKIELMRKVDYWIGIPLCFILTSIDCILKFFSFRKKKLSFEKILFIKLSEIGSIILALPLLMKIRKEYSNAEIFFLVFKNNSSIFEILNFVPFKNILVIRENSFILFLLDTIKVIKKMRRKRIDIVFDLEFFSRFTAILAYLSNAKRRIGFYKYAFEGLYRGNLLTHKIQYNPLLHISKMYLSLAEAIKLENKSTPEFEERIKDEELTLPKVNLPIEGEESIRNKLKFFDLDLDDERRLFLINPGEGNLPLREWPIENFIILSKMLLKDDKNYIIIIGAKSDSRKVNELFYTINSKRCINLAGKTSLTELLSLFNIATALIVNDSGLAHLGSLTSIKKFVFFGPESPYIFGPLDENTQIIYSNLPCSPCFSVFNHRMSICRNNRCLKLIRPEEVYNLIKNKLNI
jgi:ADP-heptose:LPS heptosyltransferase